MNCIYIGQEFYYKSGTMMSSVYRSTTHGCFERTDWGFIGIALQNGEEVHIVPATKDQLKMFEAELKKYSRLTGDHDTELQRSDRKEPQ